MSNEVVDDRITLAKAEMQATIKTLGVATETLEKFSQRQGWASLPAPVRGLLDAQRAVITAQGKLILSIHGIDPEASHERRH